MRTQANELSVAHEALERRGLLREAMALAPEIPWRVWQEVRRQTALWPLPCSPHRLLRLAEQLHRSSGG